MAHNINYNPVSKKHSFFSVQEKAWHGLGKVVSEYPTSAQAIKYAGLDYQVEKRPLFSLDNANADLYDAIANDIEPTIQVPNYFATYEAIQNRCLV